MNPTRVAAYCRVSTKKEEQEKSLESQRKYFTDIINSNPGWRFYGIYADEESGTSTKKRKGFLQMMDDARAYQFDLVLTKEISRFARNVQDSIKYTEELKKLGIEVRFLTDNIRSFNADHELRFHLMSSIYQDESRRTSQRVRWGQQRQMENGVAFGNAVYGYHLNRGKLTINENEARIIRLLFHLYLHEGFGAHRIAKHFASMGILSPTGSPHWKNATILRMLKNEKYMGTLKQKKQITTDYKTHERKTNRGEENFIIIENNHPAIIEPDLWHKVQAEIAARRAKILDKSNHSNRYWASGKIQCGLCGGIYKRKCRNNNKTVWVCAKSCGAKSIGENMLQAAFAQVVSAAVQNKTRLAAKITHIVHTVLSNTGTDMARIKNEIRRGENRLSKLIALYLDGGISRAHYDMQQAGLTKQIAALQSELQSHTEKNENTHAKDLFTIVESILNFTPFPEELCKTLLAKAVAYGKEQIKFYCN